ncbi:unnamed protein product [Rotaria magnacalcarata]|uniref:Uncharacterized protein n=1 Tax=Rotaria magnacalcarata TaxID=392030 RepID=A0A820A3F4_9BILA|nr:unnamed protein product [Rotaria magnacalcarata]
MHINDIETIYVEVHVDIICIFEDAYQHFLNQILTVHQTKHVKTKTVMLKKDVTCLFGFMKFRHDVQTGQISNFILPEDFDGKMTRLSEKLDTYSIEQAKNYKIAFETFDISSLVDILKTMCICNSLLTQIKVYHDQHINKSSIVNTIKLNLEKLTPYPDMLESICQKIENLGKELINTKLFESVNEKFFILSQTKRFHPFHLRIDVNKLEEECLESIKKEISIIYSNAKQFLDNFSQEKPLGRRD